MISNVYRYSTSLEVKLKLKVTEALLAAIGKSGVQRTNKHQYINTSNIKNTIAAAQ